MTYKRLRDLREDNDLSQEQLAKYLNVSQRTYSYYETGDRNVPVEILVKLAKFYNTIIEYLINNKCTKKIWAILEQYVLQAISIHLFIL